ncbi:MAG TPA: Crp/Fnr family transcriptional regulator [Bacteroidia bacterium]
MKNRVDNESFETEALDVLLRHIEAFLQKQTIKTIDLKPYFEVLDVKKKCDLMLPNEKCDAQYFVVNGCLRMYYINDKGNEQTTQFALENWWMSDYKSYARAGTTQFGIQAVEPTICLKITLPQWEKCLEKHPQLERYFRIIFQKSYAAGQYRMVFSTEFSKEEQFRHFSETYPEFIQRIPQYLLASFLGFTPEYLSEIRKKKTS